MFLKIDDRRKMEFKAGDFTGGLWGDGWGKDSCPCSRCMGFEGGIEDDR